MHYMHYKDYIHHGLAAEKTPPPLPQGGEPSGWGGVWGSLLIYIYIIIIIIIIIISLSLYIYKRK